MDELDQQMSPVEYRTILKYNIMILSYPINEVCLVWRNTFLDTFDENAIHC